MQSLEVQDVMRILLDESTSVADLRKLAEEHDLNPNCRRQCSLCEEFCEIEFEYLARKGTGFAVLPLYFIGEAVVNHIKCDRTLSKEIQDWVWSKSYGEWSHSIDQAIIANPNATIEQLLESGKFTVNGYELSLVKNHPNLTVDIEKQILSEREWTRWPKHSLLIDNLCIDNEDDDFDSIRLSPRED